MNEHLRDLFIRYRKAGILLDTSILLLFYVGAYSREEITRFKRTRKFTIEDHDLLVRILRYFDNRITTPNILTEVSNLANQLPQHHKSGFFMKFASGINLLHEQYISSSDIAERDEFLRFGLTDTGIVQLVQGRYLVLTDDFRLSQYLASLRVDVVNFNHIRTLHWD